MPTLKNKKRKKRNITAKGPRKRIPTRKSSNTTIEHHISKKLRPKRGCYHKKCTICLKNILINKELKKFARKPLTYFNSFRLDCRHCFHILCIKEWIQIDPICPNCKKVINPLTISKINEATNEDEPEHEPLFTDNDNHSMVEEQSSSPNYMQNYALSEIFNSIQG